MKLEMKSYGRTSRHPLPPAMATAGPVITAPAAATAATAASNVGIVEVKVEGRHVDAILCQNYLSHILVWAPSNNGHKWLSNNTW